MKKIEACSSLTIINKINYEFNSKFMFYFILSIYSLIALLYSRVCHPFNEECRLRVSIPKSL